MVVAGITIGMIDSYHYLKHVGLLTHFSSLSNYSETYLDIVTFTHLRAVYDW